MEIKKLVDYVNRSFIASDYLRAPDIYYYMDLVIDDINDRLQAKFPTFTDWQDFVARWNARIQGSNPVPGEGMPDDMLPWPPLPGDVDYDDFSYPAYGVAPHCTLKPKRAEVPIEQRLRSNSNYDAFPDKYLRSVVALGTAVKFYTRDEEGEQIAQDYQNRYEMALFKMTRDYHNQVPWYFQENTGGFIDFSHNREECPRDLVPRGVVMRGQNSKNI